MIGRRDKFLSPASLEVLEVKRDELLVRLHEPGEWLVWLAEGRPEVTDGEVTERGDGLWRIRMEGVIGRVRRG